VNARFGEADGSEDTGSVYLYEKTGAVFAKTTEVAPSDADPGARSGFRLSLDASTLAAGAPFETTEAGDETGTARTYDSILG
jgi:hypothetical protein